MQKDLQPLHPLWFGTVRTVDSWSMLLAQFCHKEPADDSFLTVYDWHFIGKN